MNKTTITIAAFAAACFAGTTAYAGPKPAKKIVEPAQESCITGDIGVDVASQYIFRGIVQENSGFIFQPWANLHFRTYKGSGLLESLTVDLGIWNSIHDNSPGNWFEFDFQAGLTANLSNKISLGTYYKLYNSPGNAFLETNTVGVSVSYDDTDLLGVWALHPYALVEFQLQGSTGNNFPPATPTFHGRGQYYEIGVTPAHSYGDLTLSLPIKAGFGSGGYYLANDVFGYFSVGLSASYALNFVPACLGKWSVNSGVTYYYLGGNNNATSRSGAAGLSPAHNSVNSSTVVVQGGLKVAF